MNFLTRTIYRCLWEGDRNKMVYKINDTVKIINPTRKGIHGMISEIIEVDALDPQRPYKLRISDNAYWFSENELVLVTRLIPQFAVNDIVTIHNEKQFNGKKRPNSGKITQLDEASRHATVFVAGRTYNLPYEHLIVIYRNMDESPVPLTSDESSEVIVKPKHYIGINGLEVEKINQNFLPKIKDGYVSHRIGSAVEYMLRHPEKNGLEDLKKAKRNLDQIITYMEGRNPS